MFVNNKAYKILVLVNTIAYISYFSYQTLLNCNNFYFVL